MTELGLKFLEHEERKRSNIANETETNRANVARETENNRHNVATEDETHRSNVAKEIETNRANVAKETEEHRSNVAKEIETNRHNTADEQEKAVHNRTSEIQEYRRQLADQLLQSTKLKNEQVKSIIDYWAKTGTKLDGTGLARGISSVLNEIIKTTRLDGANGYWEMGAIVDQLEGIANAQPVWNDERDITTGQFTFDNAWQIGLANGLYGKPKGGPNKQAIR